MARFDPYHKWLGIPPKDQPPNHYRLLGIDLFESDADVIDAAAEQRMTYLQHCATGAHLEESQKLLNEISVARLCLVDKRRKPGYDAELRQRLAANGPAQGSAAGNDLLPPPVVFAAPPPPAALPVIPAEYLVPQWSPGPSKLRNVAPARRR